MDLLAVRPMSTRQLAAATGAEARAVDGTLRYAMRRGLVGRMEARWRLTAEGRRSMQSPYPQAASALHDEILADLPDHPTVDDLTEWLGASRHTIARRLAELERDGRVRRDGVRRTRGRSSTIWVLT